MILSEHLEDWRRRGYTVVENFLKPVELSGVQRDLQSAFPSIEEYTTNPQLYRNDYRGGHMRECPFLPDSLNEMPWRPELVSIARAALGIDKLMLAQSIVWAKYPGVDDFEQPLHMDYMSSSLLYPDTQKPWEEITFIVYYSDID